MNIESQLKECRSIAVYGTGSVSIAAKGILDRLGVDVLCYVDSNDKKWGSEHNGLKVVSYDQLGSDTDIVIASSFAREISSVLRGHRGRVIDLSIADDFDRFKGTFDHEDSFDISEARKVGRDFLSGEDLACYLSCVEYRETNKASVLRPSGFLHYFHPACLPPKVGGIYIDGGSWEGDTVGEVLSFNQNCRIIAFEPDQANFSALQSNVASAVWGGSSKNVFPVPLGLWSDSRTLRFCDSADSVHTMQSRVLSSCSVGDEPAFTEIKTITIDDYLGSLGQCDFIKMDIEGSEVEALRGAVATLQNLQPKLAISAYHEPNHLWELMILINSINPRYRFFFGHHSSCMYDSVIYAKV